MGVVWAAAELESGQRRAIKLIKEASEGGPGEGGGEDEAEACQRFRHEARSAAAVRHRHVVEIVEVLELDGGRPALVMELLEGETLREVLARRGRLPLDEVLALAVPVIAAVAAAHTLGVVHRDLKPENLFLARAPGGDGAVTVKILDFGIAKVTALDGETMRTTGLTTGKVLGTPAYMAPEQVYGQTDLDHRVDIWALGLLLYQALSGVLPTAGDNIGQVFRNVTARPFAPLGELVPGLPPALATLVMRMLARERAERPAELGEVMAELRRALDGEPSGEPSGQPAIAANGAPNGAPAGSPSGAPAGPAALDWPILEPPAPALRELVRRDRLARAGTMDTAPASAASSGNRTAHAPGALPLTTAVAAGARAGRRWWRGALAAMLGTAAAGALGWRLLAADEPAAGPAPMSPSGGQAQLAAAGISPLAAPSSALACPVLQSSGVEEPAGWLGAAAASVACERARVLLGGRPERTLAPAELLDLPRAPADHFPADPFGDATARARSIAAARQRAQAYLDGEITASSAGFAVRFSLRRSDGAELAQSSGRGRSVLVAVREAMAPLISPSLLPRQPELDPEVARWARTRDPEVALASADLTFAFAHNAGELPDECRRFAEHGAATSGPGDELGLEGRWLCAYVLGRPAPTVELPPSDGTAAGEATYLRLDYLLNRRAPAGAAARLHELFLAERTPRGRSALAASESCLIGASDPRAARELAIVAVQSEPKNPEGGLCNPWEQLMTLARDTPSAEGALRAMQAWVPWNSYAWLESGYAAEGKTAALPMLRRAYALSPFDAQIAGTLAGAYLAAGDRSAARGVALALRGGGQPLHQVESDLLLVRIESSEARFAAALERALRGSQLEGGDAGWIQAQRFEMAWRAFELAMLLGKARPVADLLVARFLEAEPPPLDSHWAMVPMRLPAICAMASAPARCFARFRALRGRLPGAISEDTDAFLLGAERYAAGDWAGAARAFRPLLGGKLALARVFPSAMVEAFERTGALELAERVDAEVMLRAGEQHGATDGHVRAARRALARGDRERAAQLADQVIAAWALADEVPPGLAAMRALAAPPPR